MPGRLIGRGLRFLTSSDEPEVLHGAIVTAGREAPIIAEIGTGSLRVGICYCSQIQWGDAWFRTIKPDHAFGRTSRHFLRIDEGRRSAGAWWRRDRDSNPGCPQRHNGFRDRPVRPLRHLSDKAGFYFFAPALARGYLRKFFAVAFGGANSRCQAGGFDDCPQSGPVEATTGIEPVYTDLQSAA